MPSLTNNQVIAAVKAAFDTIDDNFKAAYKACTSDAQRDDLKNAYVGADTAYWAAINAVFQTNDGLLQTLVADIKSTTKKLKAELESLSNIVAAIKLATTVVTTALAIVALVAP